MSLTDQVHEWVAGRPRWQQELFLRVLPGAEPSDREVEAILELIAGRASAIEPRAIQRNDLPADLQRGTSLSLLSIRHCDGVNRLAADQELLLIPQGLNIVYGTNGSGKSGWARIPKHAGRTHAAERVLGDVFRDEVERPAPRAEIRWQLAENERRTSLDLHEAAPADLAGMYVFDATGGIQLVTADHEIDYVPLALKAMQRLRNAQKRVCAHADERIDELRSNTLDLAPFNTGTTVRAMLEGSQARPPSSRCESLRGRRRSSGSTRHR